MGWMLIFGVCALALACATAPTGFGDAAGTSGSNGPNGVSDNYGADGSSSTSPTTTTSLPCDLQTLLATECDTCHGSTPSQGATTSLVTRDDLMQSSPSIPSENEAQVSLARMKGGVPPMPPPPASASSASDIATLSNWIAAGYPTGSCDPSKPVSLPDGGTLPDVDAAIYDTPTVCTSGQTWTLGETKSADMKPGSDCPTCHVLGGDASGKVFDIAGTVYPTAHEPDDCDGVSTATVVITDAKGATTSLSVSAASGNFYHDSALGFLPIATPYTATVTVGSTSRAMITPQTDGSCNHCHTTAGTLSAPGRVMAP